MGDGELRDELHGQVQSQGLTKQVCLLGIRNDVPDILNAADLFVLSSRYEGHPLCVMEAMAAGLPVLSTSFAGADEMVEHGQTGWLVAQGDPTAIASAMLQARGAPELLCEMGKTGSARARSRFDVEAMSRAYENLYITRLQKSRSGTFVS